MIIEGTTSDINEPPSQGEANHNDTADGAFTVSKRQIAYDLDKINHWLKEKHLPPINYKRTARILVPAVVADYLCGQQAVHHPRGFVLTDEERLISIYICLFTRREPISSAHLVQLLQVSKNTVITDIKKGQGVSYLEQKADNHHIRPNTEDSSAIAAAVAELENKLAKVVTI